MFPLCILNLQKPSYTPYMMQIMTTIKCICLLMSVPLGTPLVHVVFWVIKNKSQLHRPFWIHNHTFPLVYFVDITKHNDVFPKLKYKPVIFILQFVPFSHRSFWRRRRKSCRFPWRMHCRNCRSSTRRTWSTWSRDCKPSIRPNGTKSISPTRKKPINASFLCNSRFVIWQFYFVFY